MSDAAEDRSHSWGADHRPAFDQESLRAHVARSRAVSGAPAKRLRVAGKVSSPANAALWTIPNYVPFAVAAAFALTPLISGLTAIDVLRHFAIGVGVLIGGVALFALTRGAIGAGVVKLAAALSVWVGGGEPLLLFLAATAILPLPLAYGMRAWRRIFRARTDADGGETPYWPTMLLAFAVSIPQTDIGVALARLWS